MSRVIIFSFVLYPFLLPNTITSTDTSINYNEYHAKIIEAEELIFIKKDSIGGLKSFKEAFQMYDFVFVDDCIEAFQLACLYKNDSLALYFIKRAIDNGFRINTLFYLNCGSPHNFYNDKDIRVAVHKDFMRKHETELRKYQNNTFDKYLKSINAALLKKLIEHHTKEQIYKNNHPELGYKTIEKQHEAYAKVCDTNLDFIESLYKKNIFIGVKNIGWLSNDLLSQLNITYLTSENELAPSILAKYNLPENSDIPVQKGDDVFSMNMVYNILFHNKKSYQTLNSYKEEAIRLGYLHPREYASLQYRRGKAPKEGDMCLEPFWREIKDTTEINKMRKKANLPRYEVDYQKFLFAQKHKVKLSFGFFNGTL